MKKKSVFIGVALAFYAVLNGYGDPVVTNYSPIDIVLKDGTTRRVNSWSLHPFHIDGLDAATGQRTQLFLGAIDPDSYSVITQKLANVSDLIDLFASAVDARKIISVFDENPFLLDSTLGDSSILIAGRVSDFDKAMFTDAPIVELNGRIRCIFNGDQASLLSGLRKNQDVTVLGKYRGGDTPGSAIYFTRCSIAQIKVE